MRIVVAVAADDPVCMRWLTDVIAPWTVNADLRFTHDTTEADMVVSAKELRRLSVSVRDQEGCFTVHSGPDAPFSVGQARETFGYAVLQVRRAKEGHPA